MEMKGNVDYLPTLYIETCEDYKGDTIITKKLDKIER